MNDPTAELVLIRRREFITRWREIQAACGGGGAGEAEKAATPETPAEMLDRLKAGAASPLRLSDAALATAAGHAPLSAHKSIEPEWIAS